MQRARNYNKQHKEYTARATARGAPPRPLAPLLAIAPTIIHTRWRAADRSHKSLQVQRCLWPRHTTLPPGKEPVQPVAARAQSSAHPRRPPPHTHTVAVEWLHNGAAFRDCPQACRRTLRTTRHHAITPPRRRWCHRRVCCHCHTARSPSLMPIVAHMGRCSLRWSDECVVSWRHT